jgi:hypothetical protein
LSAERPLVGIMTFLTLLPRHATTAHMHLSDKHGICPYLLNTGTHLKNYTYRATFCEQVVSVCFNNETAL